MSTLDLQQQLDKLQTECDMWYLKLQNALAAYDELKQSRNELSEHNEAVMTRNSEMRQRLALISAIEKVMHDNGYVPDCWLGNITVQGLELELDKAKVYVKPATNTIEGTVKESNALLTAIVSALNNDDSIKAKSIILRGLLRDKGYRLVKA